MNGKLLTTHVCMTGAMDTIIAKAKGGSSEDLEEAATEIYNFLRRNISVKVYKKVARKMHDDLQPTKDEPKVHPQTGKETPDTIKEAAFKAVTLNNGEVRKIQLCEDCGTPIRIGSMVCSDCFETRATAKIGRN